MLRAVSRFAGKRVLVAEAGAAHRAMVVHELTQCGAHVTAATSSAEAIEALPAACGANRPFDLVLLDAEIDGSAAPRLAGRMRREDLAEGAAIVLMTRTGDHGVESAGGDVRLDARVHKPLSLARLDEALTKGSDTTGRLAQERRKPSPAQSTAVRVLLAEDNIINQRLTTRILQQRGFEVDIAVNGIEAVDAAGRVEYRLVFMDCQMPEMDGYQATAAIRRLDARHGRKTPIIAVTANADREQCLRAGMDDFLAKPLRVAELDRVIERWLSTTSVPN
jgi:CheY-like chemotaxis protein